MPYRPHGRATVNPDDLSAFAVCDRCGFWYNHRDLHWAYDYRGKNLQNLRILVCDRCLDTPQEQLRPIVLPPDPLPIINARPENFYVDETDLRVTQTGDVRVTMDGNPRILAGQPLSVDWSTG